MKQSALFTKTRREDPKDEVSKNAKLLVRAGYIHKEMAGVYSYLPLGLRVVEKINQIIREEMNALGGQELAMSKLQEAELWQQTGRWSDDEVDNWFKTKLKTGSELGLGFTHEEPITRMMKDNLQSYRDLPVAVYQIGTKFRNETRAKSGILRGREFLMKDLYSFHVDAADLDKFYDRAAEAYHRIFERVGIGEQTFKTFASGGVFSKFSHEFQTLCEAGEDIIFYNQAKGIAVNKEVYTDEILAELGLTRGELTEGKAIEVGNIFKLGTRFSEALELFYLDEDGKKHPVVMGSYGLGPERLMGTIVETLARETGLIWPAAIAPFKYHLVRLSDEDEAVRQAADSLYQELIRRGAEVLYDDRPLSTGEKLSDAELIGLPIRLIVSKKTVAADRVELTQQATGETKLVTHDELYEAL